MAKQNEMNKFTSPFWKIGNFQDTVNHCDLDAKYIC